MLVAFPHSSLDLQQRLEYLSRAVISAKSASYNRADTSEGDLLHDLEEKLDVSFLVQLFYEPVIWSGASTSIEQFLLHVPVRFTIGCSKGNNFVF